MIKTPRRLKIASNYFEAQLPKCSEIAQGHSWHEFLLWGLLEGNASVVKIEPQPERIRGANGKAYIPDVRYETIDRVFFAEVKSERGFEIHWPRIGPLLTAFCEQRNAEARRHTHEELDAEAGLAYAWMRITRWVLQYSADRTSQLQTQVLARLRQVNEATLGQLIRHFSASADDLVVGAVCRLIHSGALIADLRHAVTAHMTVHARRTD